MVKPVQPNSEVDVLILCGGQGTRLRSILKDRPKVLAQIGDRPFLDILIDELKAHGFRRFILSVGHLRDNIIDHIEKTGDKDKAQFLFSEEDSPLGTGGALRKAAPLLRSDPFLVLNGDSICSTNFDKFLAFHAERGGILSLVLATPRTSPDYGAVQLSGDGRVMHYGERVVPYDAHLASAGIYLMNQAVFDHLPRAATFSLEYDLFPHLIAHGSYGFVTDGALIDIGTPERYEAARRFLQKRKTHA